MLGISKQNLFALISLFYIINFGNEYIFSYFSFFFYSYNK